MSEKFPKKIRNAVAFYQDQGHTFWVINFPSGNATWVYDAAENQWHERAYSLRKGLEELRKKKGESSDSPRKATSGSDHTR